MSKYRIKLDGSIYEMEVEKIEEGKQTTEYTFWDSKTTQTSTNVQVIDPAIKKETVNEGNVVHSPMPGTIIKILHRNGDKVEKGDSVLVLEAMKMENEISAPRSGIIQNLNAEEKTSVQGGVVLFSIVEG